MQERIASDKTENYIVHKPLDRFFINTHAFHNAHLLRATLPRDLISPVLLFPDRQAKHHALATELHETQASRKAATETKKRKRAEEDGDDEDERPRKARKGSTRQGKKRNVSDNTGSMVANRSRRAIKRSKRAMAADEEDSAEEVEGDSDDSEEGYINDSDGEYSD
jgi:hypothetical protein